MVSVSAAGFEAVLLAPPGAPAPTPTAASYLAVEPGLHHLPDGTWLQAGLADVTDVQHGAGVSGDPWWRRVGFEMPFPSPPAVLTSIQGLANESVAAAEDPWVTAVVSGLDEDGFDLALERSEVAAGWVCLPETVAYLAITPGEHLLDAGAGLEAVLSAAVLTDVCEATLSQPTADGSVLLAAVASRNDSDGGWVTRCQPAAGETSVRLEEDTFLDPEQNHDAPEQVSLLLLTPDLDAIVTTVATLSAPDLELEEGQGDLLVTVTLSHPLARSLDVEIEVVSGTATDGDDFNLPESVRVDAWQTSASFWLELYDDLVYEGEETFELRVSASPWVAASNTLSFTLADNDPPPTVAFASATGSGFEGQGVVAVPLALSSASPAAVTVEVIVSGGTATAGDDFTFASPVTFAPFATTADLLVTVVDDTGQEPDETVLFALGAITGADRGAPDQLTFTLVDDDTPPTVAFASATGLGAEGQGVVAVPLVLSNARPSPVTVEVTVSGGTATPGDDFTFTSPVTFAPYATAASLPVTLVDDPDPEAEETVLFALGAASGADLGSPSQMTFALTSDDPFPTVQWTTAAVETAETATTLSFTATLSAVHVEQVQVRCATVAGSAQAGSDFTAVDRLLTFAPGATQAVCEVPLLDDDEPEGAESFTVSLSEPTAGVTLGAPADLVVTIPANDHRLALGAPTFAVAENAGSLTVPVTLTPAATTEVSVTLSTADGTATAGLDYTAVTELVTFTPGQTSRDVVVPILTDAEPDSGETFQVALTGPVNAALGEPSAATVTILAELPAVSMAVPALTVVEADSGGTYAVFHVALSQPVPVAVDVDFHTLPGTAQPPGDYVDTSGQVHFAPEATVGTGQVWLPEDGQGELDESFSVVLHDPLNATLAEPAATTVTIIDNAFQAYDLRALHVEPDLVHLTWQQTTYAGLCRGAVVYRRNLDTGEAWQSRRSWSASSGLCSYNWRDFLVETGARYEYQVRPYRDTGFGRGRYLELDPLPSGPLSSQTVIPGLAAVVPTSLDQLPESANPFAGAQDYVLHLLPDPGPAFETGTTLDVFVDEEPAAADPSEPPQPSYPENYRGRDDLQCRGAAGAPVVTGQPCEGPSCDVVLPGLSPGTHRFRFVVTDSAGTSQRAIVQDLHPWWPVNAATSVAYPAPVVALFGDVVNATRPSLLLLAPPMAEPADSLDCCDPVSNDPVLVTAGGSTSSAGSPAADGVVRWTAPSDWSAGQPVTLATQTSRSLGRDLLARGTSGASLLQRQSLSRSSAQAAPGPVTYDPGAPVDVAPVVTWVTPAVTEPDASPVLERTVWLRVVDPDQDVDPLSVTVTLGGVTYPAFYADPSGQVRTWGTYGWFVARLPVAIGESLLTIHLADLGGHVVDHAHTLRRFVLEPGAYPEPVITLPEPGQYYGEGTTLPLDATASTVPSGYETWLGVLVDDGSEPMALHHVAAGLTGSFTASSSHPAYRVRLVVATSGRMPDEATLRGRMPPCTLGDPDLGCAFADLTVPRAGGNHVHPFEVAYVNPDLALLRWAGMDRPQLQRCHAVGADPCRDDASWGAVTLETGKSYHHTERGVLTPGETYHYRARRSTSYPWCYLGSTTTIPGLAMLVPEWTAPRVVPTFLGSSNWTDPGVDWEIPGDEDNPGTYFDGVAAVKVKLEPENPEDTLQGTEIRVFLNEDTRQQVDGRGVILPVPWVWVGYPEDLVGRDDLGCVTRRAAPDLVQYPDDRTVTFWLPGARYGANSFRFEVRTLSGGGFSERAILWGVHERPDLGYWRPDSRQLMPFLFGTEVDTVSPVISGIGPVSRPSPDCFDGDMSYRYRGTEGLYASPVSIGGGGSGPAYVQTNVNGRWVAPLSLLDGATHDFQLLDFACYPTDSGKIGRNILNAAGTSGWDRTQRVCPSGDSAVAHLHVVVPPSGTPHPPVLAYPPAGQSAVIPSTSAQDVIEETLRFRVTDVHQDVNPDSVTASNETLGSGALRAYYASSQIKPEGDWGWFVATLPLHRGDNAVRFCFSDAGGDGGAPREVCEERTVQRSAPEVQAVITEPDPSVSHSVVPGGIVQLDGSTSMAPAGGVARWSVGYYYSYWRQWFGMPQVTDFDELRTAFLMSTDWTLRARLVVASSPADLPASDWPTDGSLPCVRTEGAGRCDSAEVILNRSCSIVPSVAAVVRDLPPSGVTVTPDQPLQLQAHVSTPAFSPFAYRWLVFDAADTYLRFPLAALGADDLGNGFSEQNQAVTVTAAAEGLPLGAYTLVAEARYPASGCQDPGWFEGRSTAVSLTVGPEPLVLDAIAPGQAVPGTPVRVYSSYLTGLTSVWVDVVDAYPPVQPYAFSGFLDVQDGSYVTLPTAGLSPLPEDGAYYVSLSPDGTNAGRSTWRRLLQVVETGSPSAPLVVPPEGEPGGEEDPSCGGEGTECVHSILPGQYIEGMWGEPGDTDYFGLVAGAGTRVRVTLDRVDTTLPPQHPDAPAPEIALVRPDGVAFAASDPLGLEATGTSLEATLPSDGEYHVMARSPKGTGDYLVHLEMLEEGGTGEVVLGHARSRAHLVDPAEGQRLLSVPLLDPFGQPLAGQAVQWQAGDPCPEGFCASGSPTLQSSSWNGYAYTYVDVSTGVAHPLHRASVPVGTQGKARFDRSASLRRAERALAEQPLLGWVNLDDGAAGGGRLPDLATAKALTDEARRRASLRRQGGEAKARADCTHALTCEPDGAVTFEVATLPLAAGETLTDLRLEVRREGAPVEALGGPDHVVMSEVEDLELRAVATVAVDGQPEPEERVLSVPAGLLVTRGWNGALDLGGSVCPEQRIMTGTDLLPSPFSYLVGNDSSFRHSHLDDQGQPCCWHPTEYLVAATKIAFEWEDPQGQTVLLPRRVELWVDSTPRAEEPCEIRSMETQTPVLSTYDDLTRLQVGSVYLVDRCDNVVIQDSSQAGNQVTATTAGASVDVESNPYQWEHDLVLTSPVSVPAGGYEITVEAASDGPCGSGGVVTGTFDATVQSGRPQVILWWDPSTGHGSSPAGGLVSPAAALRDQTGQVAVWRVPAFATGHFDGLFPGGYTGEAAVPVRLWVTRAIVPWDQAGHILPEYLDPVPGVELCTGVVEKQADEDGIIQWNAPVRATCDQLWTTLAPTEPAELRAFSEPPSGPAPVGNVYEPYTWVTMGLGVGITRAPDQPGGYMLVLEPLTEPFRGGDAWAITSSEQHDGFVGFEVGGGMFLDSNRRPILDEILLGEARDVYVQFSHSGSAATLPTTVSFVKEGVTQSSASIEASRVGGTSSGASLYEGLVHLVTPAGLKRGKILEPGPTVDGRGDVVAETAGETKGVKPGSQLTVVIDDLVDDAGDSFDGEEYEPKLHGSAFVRYRVAGNQSVLTHDTTRVMVTYPNDDVHRGFYGAETDLVTNALHQSVQLVVAGVYKVGWDGRDTTPAQRILLEGTYDVSVAVTFDELESGDVVWSNTRPITISRPHASNYAPEYPADDWMGDSNFGDQVAANSSQETLHDQTGFDRLTLAEGRADPAMVALDRLVGRDALMSFVGHSWSTPGVVVFYGYDDPLPVPEHVSWLAPNSAVFPGPPERTAFVTPLDDGALKDVYFVALVACRTDSHLIDPSNHLPSVMISKGADLVLAFPIILDDAGEPVDMAELLRVPWNARFWALATGNEQDSVTGTFLNIYDAHRRAIEHAMDQCGTCTSYQEAVFQNSIIREAPGASSLEYLWPARYGSSTN